MVLAIFIGVLIALFYLFGITVVFRTVYEKIKEKIQNKEEETTIKITYKGREYIIKELKGNILKIIPIKHCPMKKDHIKLLKYLREEGFYPKTLK